MISAGGDEVAREEAIEEEEVVVDEEEEAEAGDLIALGGLLERLVSRWFRSLMYHRY